jgi:hypothetical protein
MRIEGLFERSWRTSLGNASIAIIHYPVYDKNGDIVATSITNLEIHDIARTCMTFGLDLCYIVTPLAKQRGITEKLIHHWTDGYGSRYNPVRAEALKKVVIKTDVDDMVSQMKGNPIIVGTSSKERPGKSISYREIQVLIEKETRPLVLLFGTGWGLSSEVVDRCEKMLMPIKGNGDYNHLSLRVALGIILDRIFGERGGHYE